MGKAKRKILISGIVVLVLVCVLVSVLFYSLGNNIRRDVSMAKADTAVVAIRKAFLELTVPVQRDLALLAQWGQAAMIDLGDSVRLRGKLIPLLDSLPVVNSLMIADTDGRECFIMKDGASWMIRSADAYGPNMKVRVEHLDHDGAVGEAQMAQRSFDPRTRTWFAGALQVDPPGTIYWTEVYRFKTAGKLGITASIRFQSAENANVITVVAMDILLDALYQFMAGLHVTPGSQIMLSRNDGMVMSPQATSAKSDAADDSFVEFDELQEGPVKDAFAAWTKAQAYRPSTFAFTSRQEKWWASFQPLQAETSKTWVSVLIPEADMVGNIRRQWTIYAIAIGVLLIVGAAVVGLLLQRYFKKHGSMSEAFDTDIEDVQRVIGRGESNRVEFKSTLRTNLRSGKKDKAIELAWLKSVTAFMNSEGGILFVGVDDAGAIRGIEEDEFENEDKCLLHVKNLIHEHIGSEFAGNIAPKLHIVDGKMVVSLVCRKSERPVFLKVGQNEDFFIRSGPSSTKLSMSKMVAYLKQKR